MKKTKALLLASMCAFTVAPMVIPFATQAATNDEMIENEAAELETTTTMLEETNETPAVSEEGTTEDVETEAVKAAEKVEDNSLVKMQGNEAQNASKNQDNANDGAANDTDESIPDPSKYTEIEIEGKKMYVSVKGNEWVNENGYWHFVKDGKLVKGWRQMTKTDGEKTTHWSYFDSKNGRLYTGWHQMGKAEGEKTPHWSYFGADGWLRTGWQQMGKGTGNSFGENQAKHWSYFGGNGWLQTGWKYLAKSDGEKTPHWSYFGGNGWLRTGWQQMGKGTGNSFGESSARHWSYFGANGWLRTGMQTMGTNINPDGKNKIHTSYFGGNGWLVENKLFTFNNAQYMADGKGWATKVKTEHEKVLARAMQLVAKVTNNGMTKEQKLRACYVHIRDSYPEYNPRIPHFAGEGWHTLYANDIFVGKDGKKGGNCISVGAAFAYMAKAIGYENVYAVNGTGHGWAEVNNKVYDAEWERHNKGSYYGLSYEPQAGKPNYKWIFGSSNPYARIKL